MSEGIEFKPIHEPYLKGYYAIKGNRMAEVIHTDRCEGTWEAYCYVDNKMVQNKAERLSEKQAMERAIAFLNSTDSVVTSPTEAEFIPSCRRVQVNTTVQELSQ